ncbi:MAG TPA: fumarylacetoacetate hydrolase family protein [Acidimicrobiales bacterium]|nr:fumarylacetoacetate hydrolase family protein [Acidimicrobiales bacterium]
MATALFRIEHGGLARWAIGEPGAGPQALLAETFSLDAALAAGGLRQAVEAAGTAGPVGDHRLLAPVEHQPVWAAGVTYERSRDARTEESHGSDFYERVYDAERPELFFKANGEAVRASGETIAIRADSSWNVPEPELALVAGADGRLEAVTLGNDVSSRSIEGENPLYLPQAKVYDRSCAIGPCLVLADGLGELGSLVVSMRIERAGALVFADELPVERMHRRPLDLLEWLYHSLSFPLGAFLLTGTSMVPPSELTLEVGDTVRISCSAIGTLENAVERLPARRRVAASPA